MKKSIYIIASLVVLIIGAWACSKADLASPQIARVKFFHGVSDAPATGVDIIVDGRAINLRNNTVLDTLRYAAAFPGTSDSSYLSYEAGTRKVQIAPVGTTNAVFTADVPLSAGKSYTVFAADTLAKIGAVILEDKFPGPLAGKAWLRIINLSPNNPSVDLILKSSGARLIGGQSYKTASDFIEVPTGTVAFDVRAAGATANLTSPSISLVQGRIYTLVLRGFSGRTGTQAIGTSTLIHGR